MNVNKNLHSKTVLTEFARDFEEDSSETVITKLVNKIYEACNNVNADLGTTSSSSSQSQDQLQNDYQSQSSQVSTPSGSSDINVDLKPPESPKVYVVDTSQGRTSLNVVKRISNIIAMRDRDLNDYKNTDLQKLWMPDDKSRECYDCAQKFTTFRRKHHCRLCGQIFCSKCCNQIIPGKIIKCSGDLRVCTYCSKVVLSYIKSPDINAELKSDLQALEEDLSSKFEGSSSAVPNQNPLNESSPHRKVSVGYQEERLVSNQSILSNADRKTILQQSYTLKALYEDMSVALPSLNRGSDLASFLIASNKSSNKQQAITVLNAMIEAGFIVPILTYDNNSNTEVVASDTFQVDFDDSLCYKFPKLEEIESSSAAGVGNSDSFCDDSVIEDIIPPSINAENMYTNSKELELQNSILSTAGSKQLLEAYCEHEEALLNQLLRNENLDTSWSKILIPQCARIAHTIHPEFCRVLDSMDVRNFINIKKISGGSRNECSIVGGVVFSKNVAHKDMKTKIDNPKVLLLQCPIAYQRVEGKFVTIESLILQEKEYLRNVTSRILSLAPDVVLVHKNVAGIAQDLLRDNGEKFTMNFYE
jgi:1-phosphatidylinositol-3-phosphate 5-kinase